MLTELKNVRHACPIACEGTTFTCKEIHTIRVFTNFAAKIHPSLI